MRRVLPVLIGLLLAGAWVGPARADATRDSQWQLDYLHIAEAQRQANSGDGVTVGLLDTGVDATHPDLAGSILPGRNVRNDGDAGDARTDRDGHGTAMAGLIVGHGADGAGSLGIAPKAKILPVRVISGMLTSSSSATLADGLRWATEHGAKVISVGLSGEDIPALRSAVAAAQRADVVIVAAAGDAGTYHRVLSPADYDGVVTVGGIARSGYHSTTSVIDEEVLVAAPTTDIMSTQPGGGYGPVDTINAATSAATAIVVGVVALIRARYPGLTAAQVVERLAGSATPTQIGAGPNPECGYGIVNPVAALSPDFKPSISIVTTRPQRTSIATGTATAGSRSDRDRDRTAAGSDPTSGRWPPVAGVAACVVLVLVDAALVLVLIRRRRRSSPPSDADAPVADRPNPAGRSGFSPNG